MIICALKNFGRPQEENTINELENVCVTFVDTNVTNVTDDFELFFKFKSGREYITTDSVILQPNILLWNLMMVFKESHISLILERLGV